MAAPDDPGEYKFGQGYESVPDEDDGRDRDPPPPAEPPAWQQVPPLLWEICNRWNTSTPEMFPDRPPLPTFFKEWNPKVAPEHWGRAVQMFAIYEGGPVCEVHISDAIRDAVKERSPQAILRDLFRPVLNFGITDHDFIQTGYTPGDMARQSVDTGLAGRLKLKSTLEEPLHATRAFADEIKRHREWMHETWEFTPTPKVEPEESPYDEDGRLKPMQGIYAPRA
jgi:hypothetical protein